MRINDLSIDLMRGLHVRSGWTLLMHSIRSSVCKQHREFKLEPMGLWWILMICNPDISSYSSKPSSEEVYSWSHSFEKLMKNPAGRNVFREFLRTEYSEENMLFWLACEELKKDNSKHNIEEKARLIYEDYVSILSPKEVTTP